MSIAGHASRAMLSRYSRVRMEPKGRSLTESAAPARGRRQSPQKTPTSNAPSLNQLSFISREAIRAETRTQPQTAFLAPLFDCHGWATKLLV
jgi:hypothetical protein